MNENSNPLIQTYRRLPIKLSYGIGSYLYDESDQAYLDMFSGIAVNALGHNHEKINKALHKQSQQFLHVSNAFLTDTQETLAKKLVLTSGLNSVFFSNSGTEAIEAALKIARKWGKSIHPSKTEVLAFSSAFHGRSSAGMALSYNPLYKVPFSPLLPGVTHTLFNDADALNQAVNDNVCAIFLEIIQGEGGIIPIDEVFVKSIVEAASKHNILIVIDEIQTGLLRTGEYFGYQLFNLMPDIVTVAKALGGGLPLGATIVNKKLANVLGYGEHGSTFGGNPLACALGNVVMDEIMSKPFKDHLKSQAAYLKTSLMNLQSTYPNIILKVRGYGLMLGIELNEDKVEQVKELFIKHHVLINITRQNVLRLLPPLNIERKDLKKFLDIFEVILKSLT